MNTPIADLHCHILPGIDDGSADLNTTAALLKQEVTSGVSCIMFTPHFYYERDTVGAFAARRANAYAQTLALISASGVDLHVNYGAEVYFTPALSHLDLDTLAFHGSKYILIELPTRHRPSGIEETLYNIQCKGFIPILAHVERYAYVTEDPTLLYEWVSGGAYAHVNASALIRRGRTAQLIKKYINWGLVHFMCSDAHSPDERPANLGFGYKAVSEEIGNMMRRNAFAIFRDETPDVPEADKPRRWFGKWV